MKHEVQDIRWMSASHRPKRSVDFRERKARRNPWHHGVKRPFAPNIIIFIYRQIINVKNPSAAACRRVFADKIKLFQVHIQETGQCDDPADLITFKIGEMIYTANSIR